MSKDKFGPWIEHKPGDPCPIPDAKGLEYEVKVRNLLFEGPPRILSAHNPATDWDWGNALDRIIAYRTLKQEQS